jgi:hypothetical protein
MPTITIYTLHNVVGYCDVDAGLIWSLWVEATGAQPYCVAQCLTKDKVDTYAVIVRRSFIAAGIHPIMACVSIDVEQTA